MKVGTATAAAGGQGSAAVHRHRDRERAGELDLVQHHGLHGVLTLNGVHSQGHADVFTVQPLVPAKGPPQLVTKQQWIVTSAQRPRCPLNDRTTALLGELMLSLCAKPTAALG